MKLLELILVSTFVKFSIMQSEHANAEQLKCVNRKIWTWNRKWFSQETQVSFTKCVNTFCCHRMNIYTDTCTCCANHKRCQLASVLKVFEKLLWTFHFTYISSSIWSQCSWVFKYLLEVIKFILQLIDFRVDWLIALLKSTLVACYKVKGPRRYFFVTLETSGLILFRALRFGDVETLVSINRLRLMAIKIIF